MADGNPTSASLLWTPAVLLTFALAALLPACGVQ